MVLRASLRVGVSSLSQEMVLDGGLIQSSMVHIQARNDFHPVG